MINVLSNKEKSITLKKTYLDWKLEALDQAGYFVIFQGLLEENILQKISGNALKLYIYIGINSNNMTGIVWHSNTKIALYFNKSERTIRSWMKELEDLNLIERMRLNYNGCVFTYLKPYSFKKTKIDVNSNKENEDSKSDKEIFAELIIDSIGSLYIKDSNMYLPVTNDMSIEIKRGKEWIQGKIEIRRNEYNWNENESIENLILRVKYIFKIKNSNDVIEINNNNNLKVRVSFNR